jgi:hypothetical protein
MERSLSMEGGLVAKKISAPGPGLAWHLRNRARKAYLWGRMVNAAARRFSKLTGVPTMIAELEARKICADGRVINYGTVAYRVVTDAGVAYMVDDWDGGADDIDELDFHGCGTGVGGEAVGDTALGAESTTILNPDSTRASGTNTQPAANQFRTIVTLTFDGAGAITEHGIFDQAATGGGTLWDRSVFSAINVANGDSIEFTYTLTITSGG